MKHTFSIPVIISLIVVVPACTTTSKKAIEYTCAHKAEIVKAAEATIKTVEKYCPIIKDTE